MRSSVPSCRRIRAQAEPVGSTLVSKLKCRATWRIQLQDSDALSNDSSPSAAVNHDPKQQRVMAENGSTVVV